MENLNFLTLDDVDISDSKILTEYIPLINKHLLEINDIKKRFRDNVNNVNNVNNADPIVFADKSSLIKKIKLIVDLISIYNNPNIFMLIKQYTDEKTHELESKRRDDELEKNRQNFFKNHNNISRRDAFYSSSEEEVLSDVSEDEFEKDKVKKMLDEGYEDIKNHSMLMNNYDIKKHCYCSIQNASNIQDDRLSD